jgi:hypothetical protein
VKVQTRHWGAVEVEYYRLPSGYEGLCVPGADLTLAWVASPYMPPSVLVASDLPVPDQWPWVLREVLAACVAVPKPQPEPVVIPPPDVPVMRLTADGLKLDLKMPKRGRGRQT